MDSVYNDSNPNDEWQINADSDDFCLKSNDDREYFFNTTASYLIDKFIR